MRSYSTRTTRFRQGGAAARWVYSSRSFLAQGDPLLLEADAEVAVLDGVRDRLQQRDAHGFDVKGEGGGGEFADDRVDRVEVVADPHGAGFPLEQPVVEAMVAAAAHEVGEDADRVDELGDVDRFLEVVARTVADGLDRGVLAPVPRHDDDARLGGDLLDAGEEFQPVDPRHAHVGDHDVRWLAGEELDGLAAVGGLDGVVAVVAQDLDENSPDGGIVFDEQDPQTRVRPCPIRWRSRRGAWCRPPAS